MLQTVRNDEPCKPSGSDYRCFFTKFTVDTLDHSIQTGSISVDHTALHAVDGVAQSNAVTELHKRDVQRGNYYHYFSKKTWGDRNHYDLCLNTAELGYEKAAEILAAAAK